MQVAIPLFPRFTALDAIGPYEVLQRIPTIDVTFVGHDRGEVRSENGMLGVTIDATFEEMPTTRHHRVPRRRRHTNARRRRAGQGMGSHGSRDDDLHDIGVHRFARARCRRLLNGLTATTHWSCYPELEATGATPTAERVVEHLDRRIITAAGVSSGIDMALRLVELLVDRTAAQASQLMIEYDPQPPFDNGSLAKCNDEIVTRVIEYTQLRK